MGLIGKAGVVLAGGIPVALATIDAIDPWTSAAYGTLSIRDKLVASAWAFSNNLTQGFGVGPAFPTNLGVVVIQNSAASGSYIKTTAGGLSLVVIDGVIGAIMRFAAGGRARPKIMGRQLISG